MNPLFEADSAVPILGNRYKLINQLGVGGFGQSFLAQDLHLPGCPRCVVKRLLTKTKDSKHLKTARRLFDTEARVLYQLGKHEQIPALHAHFEENQEFYLVQEFIEGEPLTWQIVKGQPWPEGRVIALMYDILEVLAFVHEQNVIHRDIKPSNLIRRQRDGKIVLIDFGAVKQVSVQFSDPDSDVVDSTISVGTHGYISNEQLAGRPRFCSDVYAVGIVGIQALTGVVPKYLGEVAATGELDWRSHVPNVTPELAEVIDRMVYYDFRDRYPTAIEALDALKGLPPGLTEIILGESYQSMEEIKMDSTLHFTWDGTATEVNQTETGTTNASGYVTNGVLQSNIIPTRHQEETLTFTGRNSSSATSKSEQLSFSQTGLPPSSKSSKWFDHQSLKPWLFFASGLAIASTMLFSLKLNVPFKPNQPVSQHSSVVKLPPPTRSPQPKPLPLTAAQQVDKLQKQAAKFLQQGEYQKALDAYDQLIQQQPKAAAAYLGKCESLSGLKQYNQAIVACNDALDLKPNDAAALVAKGKAIKQQDPNQVLTALGLFEEATIVQPDLADAWVERGATLQEVGRSEEAIEALDQAIALNRNSAEAWSLKGSALWNLGRFDPAIAAVDKALQIQPQAKDAKALREKAKAELGY